jgi:hypothetical protein
MIDDAENDEARVADYEDEQAAESDALDATLRGKAAG